MVRIGKSKLGASVVAAGMMLLGISNPAYTVPRSPSVEINPATGGLGATEMAFGEIRAGEIRAGRASGLASADAKSYSCKVDSSSAEASPQYDIGSPPMLKGVKWTASGSATCTIPMKKISYKIVAGIVRGPASHTIAAGSCKGCSKVAALDKGYTCVHGDSIAANCSGAWDSAYRVDFTPPPGKKFKPTSDNCAPLGAGAVCYVLAPRGVAPLYATSSKACKAAAMHSIRQASAAAEAECYNLPPSGLPLLDLAAIQSTRDSYFPGGSKASDAKGLFLDTVANSKLAEIYEAGLRDKGQWVLNKEDYYEKTFAFPGVGNRSVRFGGGLPSTKVTLVVTKFGHDKDKDKDDKDNDKYTDIIAMHPADS